MKLFTLEYSQSYAEAFRQSYAEELNAGRKIKKIKKPRKPYHLRLRTRKQREHRYKKEAEDAAARASTAAADSEGSQFLAREPSLSQIGQRSEAEDRKHL